MADLPTKTITLSPPPGSILVEELINVTVIIFLIFLRCSTKNVYYVRIFKIGDLSTKMIYLVFYFAVIDDNYSLQCLH